ncbi:ATPase, partial [Streptomyces sp. NPDC088135]
MSAPRRSPESTAARAGAEGAAVSGPYVLGVDSGGSGLRVALGAVGGSAPVATTDCGGAGGARPAGVDARPQLEKKQPAARQV